MNARERKRLVDAIETYLPEEFREPIIAGVDLLRAAQSGEGGTPETDEASFNGAVRIVSTDFAKRLERQRNGFAKEVLRLREDAALWRTLKAAGICHHDFSNGPFEPIWAEGAKRVWYHESGDTAYDTLEAYLEATSYYASNAAIDAASKGEGER